MTPENDKTLELEIVAPVEEKLVKYAGEAGLEQATTTPLVAAFRPIFVQARTVLADAVGVAESVKDATCVTEIKRAYACRQAIRRVRIEGEKVRKAQKANALIYGKAVDGFYNILEADLIPVEKALQDAEDTAERAETARKDAIEAGRKAALAPYVADVALYAVRDMAEPAFAALLTGVRVAREQAEAAAKKVEEDRIAKEKADAAEQERIRAENARLQQEAIAREAAAKAEREAAEKKLADERAEAARIAAEEKAKADAAAKQAAAKAAQEKAEIEAKAKAERERLEAIAAEDRRKAAEAARLAEEKAKAEREAWEAKRKKEQDEAFAAAEITRKRVAAEKAAADELAAKEKAAREKAEAEAKALRDAAAKKAADEAMEAKKRAAAPDKDKLLAFAQSLRALGLPDFKTQEAKSIGVTLASQREKFAVWIETKAQEL